MVAGKRGRPPAISADAKDLVIEAIMSGMSVRKACQSVGVEVATWFLTLGREPELVERYNAARAAGVDALVEDAEEAAEDARRAENGHQVAGAKVYIDHKRWMASRIAPQRWGEKSMVHVSGQISTDETDMAKRIAFLQAINGNGPGDAEPDDDEEESLV